MALNLRANMAMIAGATATSLALAPVRAVPTQPSGNCAAFVGEAARRSGLSAEILLRVMRLESDGNGRALSPRGAMGCMQIMSATWRDLSVRYNLGDDPYDARLNMIGGALYLAELGRQFGFPAAYSAYNAGPGRYHFSATNGVSLPRETLAYVARMTNNAPTPTGRSVQSRWRQASLFVVSILAPGSDPEKIDRSPRKPQIAPGLFPLPDRPHSTRMSSSE